MSNIPEDIMGKEGKGELGAKKPDFGIFEKMEKGLDDAAEAAESAEVNVEKIMDSRTRKSMYDTMEIKPPEAIEAMAETVPEKAQDAAGAINEKAEDAKAAVEEKTEEVAEKAEEAKAAIEEKAEEVKDAAKEKAEAVKDAVEEKTEEVAEKAGEVKGAAGKVKAADIPSDPRDVLKDKIETTKRKKGWHVLLIELIVIVIAVIVTFAFILGSSTVKGTSMEPNYFEGDRVLYLKAARSFEQNDVIIFHTDENRDLIKRVIAVEGDVVDIDDGEVLVNGTPVESLNVSQSTEESVSGVSDPVDFPLTVKEGHVFVLGDNRSVSIDSRTKKIGQISKKDIAGRVFYMMRSKTK